MNWVSMLGEFKQKRGWIVFKGGLTLAKVGQDSFPSVGNYVSDQNFGGGIIEATINFPVIPEAGASCCLMPYYDSETGNFVIAGIRLFKDVASAFFINEFTGSWHTPPRSITGDKSSIRQKVDYYLKLSLLGSHLELFVNGINVTSLILPFYLPRKATGIWCQSSKDIIIKGFKVTESPTKAFVIMKYSTPYNELFSDVIEPKCHNFNVNAIRADQIYGPGQVLSDIRKQIEEAKFIIAEITPENQNVFFEVGYAHAMGKPIIFIAEKGKELPFDVSGFRVIFYENSIGGKRKVEEELHKHLEAMLTEWGGK